VETLINWERGWWDQELLATLFTEEESSVIKTIPISQTNQPDALIWRCTNSGVFSVKSAYHLAKELEGQGLPEGSRQIRKSSIWKHLWSAQVPNTAKNFLWRACHNLLPTKDNLLRRKVVDDPRCPICEREPETGLHALWGCPAASDVWGCSSVVFQKCSYEGMDFLGLAELILFKYGKENWSLFIQLARQIWMRRNKWVHDGIFIDPNTLLRETVKFMEEFKEVNKAQPSEANAENNNGVSKWKAPPPGWCKANWDASIDKNRGQLGIGVVVRDDKGLVIAAASKVRQGLFEPVMGEAIASYEAARICKELSIPKGWLEGDAKIIVDALNSDERILSRYGHLVEDTRSILQSFPSWKCDFVHREANEAAHRLAKAATTYISDRMWWNYTPDCISDIILVERTALSL
jgi:hypothetical protein